ncbi:hypothetical protein PAXINDRAFT_14175 [Paxillus involutus ATCC 200175]|uniref:Uncharacterized protein n=1 Tax=Paxillus involutus ATCC 200175 TaxID=664439 RepID=A0A0C9U0V2_PAXIN|nr:hypothetical protein PAXINDRAFT_14175 [Paxillus involutus ATCC 200175]
MPEYQRPDGIAVAIWDSLPDDMKQRIAAVPAQGGRFAVDPSLLRPTPCNHDANRDGPHEDMRSAWQRTAGESEPAWLRCMGYIVVVVPTCINLRDTMDREVGVWLKGNEDKGTSVVVLAGQGHHCLGDLKEDIHNNVVNLHLDDEGTQTHLHLHAP